MLGERLISYFSSRERIQFQYYLFQFEFENSSFAGCPDKHVFVALPCKTGILDAHDVEVGLATQQPTHNAIVEVFVGGEAQHQSVSLDRFRARSRSRMP